MNSAYNKDSIADDKIIPFPTDNKTSSVSPDFGKLTINDYISTYYKNIIPEYHFENYGNTYGARFPSYQSVTKSYEDQNKLLRSGDGMDNSQLLEKYIEKVDRDQSDLRSDIRESERRTAEQVSAIQERMDNRLNRIEDMLFKQNETLTSKIDGIEGKIGNYSIAIWGVCLATIIGIAAMVITIILN